MAGGEWRRGRPARALVRRFQSMVNLVDFQLRPVADEEVAWRSGIYLPEPVPQIQVRVRYTKQALQVSAEAIFVALFGEAATAFWLDSSRHIAGVTRFSFMGDASGADVIRYRNTERSVAIDCADGTRHDDGAARGFFHYLRERLRGCHAAAHALPFDFLGGFVGYLGYELKAECGGRMAHRSPLPDAGGLWVRRFVAIDHAAQEVYAVALSESAEQDAAASAWLASVSDRIASVAEPPAPHTLDDREAITFALEMNAARYMNAVARALDYIEAGDTYEVCLTNRIRGELAV